MWPVVAIAVLAVLAIAALPRWRYMRRTDLGYGPTVAAMLLLIAMALLWGEGML